VRYIDCLVFVLISMTSVDASPSCSVGAVKNYGFEDKFLKLVGLLRQHYSLSQRTSGVKDCTQPILVHIFQDAVAARV
jgi:hypothetical protein